MSETSQHKLHWLPNALTVGRILLIPVLVYFLLQGSFKSTLGWESWNSAQIALAIFLFCMLTDFLDGKLSRSWNATSDFGRMLDPIADKLLVAASLICICIAEFADPLILIPALVIIGRDITVSGVREYAALSRKVMPPTKLAKWKTATEMLAIVFFIVSYIFPTPPDHILSEWSGALGVNGTSGFISGNWLFRTIFGALLWLAAILSVYTGFRYFRAALVKTEVIDGPLDVKPFTDLTDQE